MEVQRDVDLDAMPWHCVRAFLRDELGPLVLWQQRSYSILHSGSSVGPLVWCQCTSNFCWSLLWIQVRLFCLLKIYFLTLTLMPFKRHF